MRIIDADKYQKDLLSTYDDCSVELEVLDRQPLVSAIPISDKMTNGDMIKTMFPNAEYKEDELGNVFVISSAQLGHIAFRECWWNSPYTPYKKEREV